MVEAHAVRTVNATRYLTPLREGGSLPGLVEADDDGLYVVKFRGAGQGPGALVAEVLVGELARALGLPVPELVRAELDATLGAAEPDPEIQELITASGGTNLGVDYLPGSLGYVPGGRFAPDAGTAAAIVWLDALTTNVDRTPRNPNLLVWHDRLWLIDHGAALYRQHAGIDPEADADRPFPQIADHVLLELAGPIPAAHERLRDAAAAALPAAAAEIPDEWTGLVPRETLVDYLHRRLSAGGFVTEAEDARARA
jgi:hypothetical protein